MLQVWWAFLFMTAEPVSIQFLDFISVVNQVKANYKNYKNQIDATIEFHYA